MPFFTYPLAWIAAITLPALAAIYFLRHRYRKQPVSSLLLWQMHRESREGGRRVERPTFPLVFFLELLVLLLLVLAATGPRWQVPRTTRPLIVVLDDSQSMLAGPQNATPRARALEHLETVLSDRSFSSFQLIAAGSTPRLMGDKVEYLAELKEQFPRWTCQAPDARLEAALGLARTIGNNEADILVLTDHNPPAPIAKGRVTWAAFGQPHVNFAFINAARTAADLGDRCLFEIANLSATPGTNTLRITAGTNLLSQTNLVLGSNSRRRFTLPVGEDTPTLHAKLGPDALLADNTVNLVPALRREVRVSLSLTNAVLSRLIIDTLDATGLRSLTNHPPELIIHQTNSVPAQADAWSLRLMEMPEKPERYTGPFVVDAAHPITRGLSLPGLVWGGDPGATNVSGYLPVITAGNVPLLTHRASPGGRHHLNLRYAPAHSTVHETPQWPALFWNLLEWRAAAQPGLRETNHRLGVDVPYRPAGDAVTLKREGAADQSLPAPGSMIALPVPQPGLYTVASGSLTNRLSQLFSVNFIAGAESDLSKAATGESGGWRTDTDLRFEYASILPYLILLALAFAVGHLFVIARQGGRV